MANYLPVLLVSVSTNASIPDDSSLTTLPRGQVDYLSHDWQEEDVWRSWRNMTKQKNEITNGMRLENASWRTWWKQRNKLKTVSPETLNWLKDSDVTWLYGPLHTAVDWTPPPKPKADPTSVGKDNTAQDRLDLSISAKKPILKHRSISELLTSDLPTPVFSPVASESSDEEELEDILEENEADESEWTEGTSPSPATPLTPGSSRKRRPRLLQTKSDSHVQKWSPSRAFRKDSPPRVIAPEPGALDAESSLIPDTPRSAATTTPTIHPSPSYVRKSSSRVNSSSNVGNYFDSANLGAGGSSSAISALSPPSSAAKKKHISFNTFVEQCIAIEQPKPLTFGGYEDDDDTYHATSWSQVTPPSESDSEEEEEEDDEDVLEMRSSFSTYKPRSKSKGSVSSTSSASTSGSSTSSSTSGHLYPYPYQPSIPGGTGSFRDRPPLMRTSSADKDSNTNAKEHVTIAPIAPTILKTTGVGNEYDISSPTGPHVWTDGLGDEYSDDGSNTYDASLWHGMGRARAIRQRDRERERERERERTRGHGGVPVEVELVYVPPLGSNYHVQRGSGDTDEVYHHREAWFSGGNSRSTPTTSPTVLGGHHHHHHHQPLFVDSPAFLEHSAAPDAYDYFAGPDLGEDFIAPSLTRRKRDRLVDPKSPPVKPPSPTRVSSAPELVISGDAPESRGREARGRSDSSSRSRSKSFSRTPSPQELAAAAQGAHPHATAAIAVPGAGPRSESLARRSASESESGLLSPPSRGRSLLPTSSSSGSLQSESRGRSVTRTRSSSSISDRSAGSPLGSLSPDGSSLGLVVGSIASVYAGGRIIERERGRSSSTADRGRDTSRKMSDSLSPEIVPSSSPRSPLVPDNAGRRSSDSRRTYSSSSSTTVMPSGLRLKPPVTAPSIPQPVVAAPVPVQAHAPSSPVSLISSTKQEVLKEEEALRSSHPTPSNSPVRSLTANTSTDLKSLPEKSATSSSPIPIISRRSSDPKSPSKPSPSKSATPPPHPPPFLAVAQRPSDPTMSISKASPGRVITSGGSPVVENHDENGTIVGRAVGTVLSAGAYLGGLFNH